MVKDRRYHTPFCAFDDAYSRPLPPTENWLDQPVEAGERYEDDGH